MSTLCVFARAPVAGQVKRRLGAGLGERAAASLYEAFLDDVCALGAALAAQNVRRVLCVTGGAHPALERIARAHGFVEADQGAGDLGARMNAAITRELKHGPVCVIGSDSPTIPRPLLEQAFAELSRHDLVLGPANDGGYWLVGARRAAPELFTTLEWGTAAVLPETLARLRGADHALLPFWYDVDDLDGVALLRSHLAVLAPEAAPATRRALAALGLL